MSDQALSPTKQGDAKADERGDQQKVIHMMCSTDYAEVIRDKANDTQNLFNSIGYNVVIHILDRSNYVQQCAQVSYASFVSC